MTSPCLLKRSSIFYRSTKAQLRSRDWLSPENIWEDIRIELQSMTTISAPHVLSNLYSLSKYEQWLLQDYTKLVALRSPRASFTCSTVNIHRTLFPRPCHYLWLLWPGVHMPLSCLCLCNDNEWPVTVMSTEQMQISCFFSVHWFFYSNGFKPG